MTCDQYLEILWDDSMFHSVISEQYWSHGVNTEELFEYMLKCAKQDGVILSDMNVWDYDKAMYECYQSSDDKGLS